MLDFMPRRLHFDGPSWLRTRSGLLLPGIWVAICGSAAGSYFGTPSFVPLPNRYFLLWVVSGSLGALAVWATLAVLNSKVIHAAIQDSLRIGANSFSPLVMLWSSPVVALRDIRVWGVLYPLLFFLCGIIAVLWKLGLEPSWIALAYRWTGKLRWKPSPRILLVSLCAVYTSIFIGLMTLQFENYAAGIDLAIFNNIVWNTVHGKPFYFSFEEMNFLGRHFLLGLLLIAPIYAAFPYPVTLAFIEVVAVSLSAVPVYLIAGRELKSRNLALGVAAVYLSMPVLDSILTRADFHTDLVIAPFLTMALYCWIRGRRKQMVLFLFAVLSMKEDASLLIAAFGIYLLAYVRDVKYGAVVLLMGASWFVLSFYVILPFFGGQDVLGVYYGYLGQTPSEIILTTIRRPDLVAVHVLTRDKAYYLLGMFLPVLALPLANFSLRRWNPALRYNLIFIAAPTLLENLLSDFSVSFVLGAHLSAVLAPALVVPMIYGLKRISQHGRVPKIFRTPDQITKIPPKHLAAAVVLALILLSIPANYYLSRLPVSKWPSYAAAGTYMSSEDSNEASELVALIPDGASISATYSDDMIFGGIMSHLSSRSVVYIFPRHVPGAQYIIEVKGSISQYHSAMVQSLLEQRQYRVIFEGLRLRLLMANGPFTYGVPSKLDIVEALGVSVE